MTERFHIPGRVSPARSLLGRACRAVSGLDERAGSARFFVLLPFLGALWLIGIAVIWELGPTSGSRAFLIQGIWTGTLALLALAGWEPSTCVSVHEDRLEVRHGREVSPIPFDGIHRVQPVAADTAWQHYRRYAKTRWRAAPDGHDPVLVETPGVVWILGIRPAERARFLRVVADHLPEAVQAGRLVA